MAMMFFLGLITMCLIFTALFELFSPLQDTADHIQFKNTMPFFRVGAFFIYTIFASGVCIQVFQSFGVNYLYIFDIDPHKKLNHYQLYKIALIMLFFLCFAMSLVMLEL